MHGPYNVKLSVVKVLKIFPNIYLSWDEKLVIGKDN
jgi:hypothetical protein